MDGLAHFFRGSVDLYGVVHPDGHTPGQENPVAGIQNDPKDIQEAYFKTHELIETAPLSRRTVLIKSAGILLFLFVLSFGAWLCGARGFRQGFLYTVLMFALVGAYDTFFLDWVLFARLPLFRLPGTEHMDEAYRQKWFHVKGMLFPGSLYALILGLLTGLIVRMF